MRPAVGTLMPAPPLLPDHAYPHGMKGSLARFGVVCAVTLLPFLAMIGVTVAADPGCGVTSCLTPSLSQSEALFSRIEQRYPEYFSPAATTQVQQIEGSTAHYRLYANPYNSGLGTYRGGLWYALGGAWSYFGTLDEGNQQFCGNTCWIPANATSGTFRGNIVLGSPTMTSIQAKVMAEEQGGTAQLAYGTASGVYDGQSAATELVAGRPAVIRLDGLRSNTRYYYRLRFQSADGSETVVTDEYTFHTARPRGSTFSFTVQADSHLDENSLLDQYRLTLGNVRSDLPDFHVDLGDTFMCEKHSVPLSATALPAADAATVFARYRYERANFGLVSHSAPLFLVNGNHEGEAGWLADGTANNIAVWTAKARQEYFVNPVPDGFYSGDTVEEAFVGKRAAWYAWEWGDALFVVLDPFWYSKTMASRDAWAMTLGDRQYLWLQQTLAASQSKFKFVFLHNLVGGLDGQMRGGIEAAPYFEWGGRELNGTQAFARKRPTWSLPIHQLLVRHGVTAVFHGHDHLYAKQDLDGIVYQEVPQPSAKNFQSGATLASEYHYASGTILSSSGHLRVNVTPDAVTVQYVRSWLPANETSQRKNRQVDHIWSVSASSGSMAP